jgi:hypothetical protein
MEAHLAAALNAKTMFSVKHLLDLHHHHHHHDSSGGAKGDVMRLQLSAAAAAAAATATGGPGPNGPSDVCSPTLTSSGGSLHDDPAAVAALMPELQQLTGGGSGGPGGSSPVAFGVDVPDLAQAAVAMASCYDQDFNPYTRWLQSNTSLDYYTGMSSAYVMPIIAVL